MLIQRIMVGGCVGAVLLTSGCGVKVTRVAPGTSVRKHLQSQHDASLVAETAAANTALPQQEGAPMPVPGSPDFRAGNVNLPPIEPGLPSGDLVSAVADEYTKATLALQQGRDAEATKLFENVVQIEPLHTDAWTRLAYLYEKSGNTKRALEAYRKAKDATAASVDILPPDAGGGIIPPADPLGAPLPQGAPADASAQQMSPPAS